MNWRIAIVVICLLFVAGIVAVVFVGGEPPGKSVVFGGSGDPDTLDPQGINWGEQTRICWSLFESLVTFGADDASIQPGLATEWSTTDGGLTWEFTLRDGVKFHDGTDFNAEAVVFAFERMHEGQEFAPKATHYAHHYDVVDSVEAVDPTHVRFRLKEASAVFLPNLAMFSAAIPSPTAVKKHGGTAFGLHPVGTGPYRLKEWRAKEKVVLERFDGYWGAKPQVETVIVLPIRDPATRVERLLNGEIDIMDNISLADLERLDGDPNIEVSYEVSMNIGYLGFNWNKHPYNDINFKKAVAHAIDRDKLNEVAFFGRSVRAVSILPPAIEGHDSEIPKYDYDPKKAKSFLDAVPNLPETVELWHMTFSRPYFPEPDKVAESIQHDLEAIGLEVRLSGYPRDAYDEKTLDPDHPMFLLGWSTDNADPDNFLYTLLHENAIPGNNRTFFDHPQFNRMTREAQTERDPAKRRELYSKAQIIYKQNLPSIPLAHVRQATAFRRRLTFDMHPIETRLFTIGLRKRE